MQSVNSRHTLLIVDDEKDLAKVLKLNLEAHGYRVFTATDAQTDLRVAQELKPDLIILDITMPGKSGLALYRQLSTEHERLKYPVLVMTAREDLRRTFSQIDVDGFISKPFEMSDLVDKIERILRKKKKSA